MSHKNPISFGFSILFEIAAVVAIVSVLPRIDLRPSAAASQTPVYPVMNKATGKTESYASWPRTSWGNNAQSSPEQHVIEASPKSPQYVEERLDRASQQLLNRVGGAVNQASDDLFRGAPARAPQREVSARRPIEQPAPVAPMQQYSRQTRVEPRPWLKY